MSRTKVPVRARPINKSKQGKRSSDGTRYRITSSGDILYITEIASQKGALSTYPASIKHMKRIMKDKGEVLEVDVDELSKIQYGNVIRALEMIGTPKSKVSLSRERENGRQFLVAKLK